MNELKERSNPVKTNSALFNFATRNWPTIVFCLIHAVIFLFIFQSSFIYRTLSVKKADFSTEYDYASSYASPYGNVLPYDYYSSTVRAYISKEDNYAPQIIRADLHRDYDYASLIVHGGYVLPIWEYDDTPLYFSHFFPYRDFSVEYQPLALLFITLPRLVAPYYHAYVLVFTVELLLFDIVGMLILISLSKEMGQNPWKILGVYTIAMLAVGPLVVARFDLIPAILTLASIFSFVKRHTKTAWSFLAMATFTKIYPLVIAPLFFLIQFNRKEKKELLGGLATFVITSAVITIPCILLSPGGFWASFSYHAQRPLQIESTYASILELLSALKLFTIDLANSFGSTNIIGPLPDTLAKISTGVMILSLIAIYWSVYRRLKKGQMNGLNLSVRADETAFVIKYILMTILVFILTFKVFSPQYIIWLLPLIPLTTQKSKNVIWWIFILVGIMTFFIFPKYYDELKNGSLIITATLVIRNLTLVGILLLLIRGHLLKAADPERL